ARLARCALAVPTGPTIRRSWPTDQVGPAWARAATLRVAAEQTQDQRHDEQHQEDEEQHLRNFDGAGRNTPEAKQRRDERDHKKYDSVVQHTLLPCQEPRSPSETFRARYAVTANL